MGYVFVWEWGIYGYKWWNIYDLMGGAFMACSYGRVCSKMLVYTCSLL